MTGHDGLYRLAEYYDIAFDFRDVGVECDFLTELYRRSAAREPASFLELAAGPAYHTIELARRGLRATALDLSPAMVRHGRAKAAAAGVAIDYVEGDMTGFSLPATYDLAALLMASCEYLLDNDAVLSHLDRVADHLNDGGLYVVEMSHPRDAFEVGRSTKPAWDMERDGTRVHMEWGHDGDPFDPITQLTEVSVRVEFEDGTQHGSHEERAPQRAFTANELRALVAASGRFEIAGMYGSMSVEIPFGNDKAAWRMVPVLRRVR
jgi:SAM-dependent methyltransferase